MVAFNFFILLAGHFGLAKSICEFDLKNLPKCAQGNKLAEKHQMAAQVYLSEVSRSESAEIEKLVEGTSTYFESPFTKPLTGFSLMDQDSELNGYPRDGNIFSVEKNNGTIKVVNNYLKPLNSKMTIEKFCGWPVEFENILVNESQVDKVKKNTAPYRGGNIMSLPGGTCLTSTETDDFFVKKICGHDARVLKIKTKYTRIGHIDEVMNVIPNRSNACGFSIVMASSERAENLLKEKNAKNDNYINLETRIFYPEANVVNRKVKKTLVERIFKL